jgi:hypothetical protein
LKSGSLNLLEPSGPVQACNGIALPFYYLDAFVSYFITILQNARSIYQDVNVCFTISIKQG